MAAAPGDPITAANLARLSVDGSNRLYWNGREVRTRLQLKWWQGVVAGLAAVASLTTVCTGLNNLTILVCSRGVRFPVIGCPAPPPPTKPTDAKR